MESNIYRTKLLNALLFFAKETKFANTTKISKLLYLLDFTHFKQTGYPSIGLRYYASPKGAVPKDFWLEIKDGNVPDDFKDKLSLVMKKDEFKLKQKPKDAIPEYAHYWTSSLHRVNSWEDLSTPTTSYKEIKFKALKNPDLSVFTPREIKILDNLASMFRDVKAKEISEISHLPNQPWDITIKKKGKNAPIDYLLALDKDSEVDEEYAKESLKEHFEVIKNFSLEPTKK